MSGSKHQQHQSAQVQAKIQQYQQFIENTLQRDLHICSNLQEKVQQRYND